ncbi:MAG: ribonuclease HII [Lentisphaeria bacterium]|nr:ribonuclease HII [Lentisphaeria bacterium]
MDFLPGNSELLVHELKWDGEFSFIAGVDEAGRGCCAGPVCAAAVVFTDRTRIPAGVNDSKQLTHKQRMELREAILAEPSALTAVAMVDQDEIDRTDILRATWLAMRRAVLALPRPADFVLVDGNPVQGLPIPSENIVKGDAKSASIAAASILAKTSRDIFMMEAAKQYPQYRFEVHKGYCTKLHTDLIRKYGPCPLHRKTFEPVRSILNPPDTVQGEFQF